LPGLVSNLATAYIARMRGRLLLALLVGSVACGGAVESRPRPVNRSLPPPFAHLTGTVHDARGLDGCGWLVEGDDGRTYEPLNWPVAVQNQGLRIAADVTFRADNNASVCMVGFVAEFANVEIVQ
jgi:hypothetical protein